MPKKKEETFDGRIWGNILEFNVNLDSQLISKANFIFGASTLILVYLLNKLLSTDAVRTDIMRSLPLLILMIGCFISALLSIMVILPKLRVFSRKERFKEDVFYYKNITNFFTRDEYRAALKDLPKDNARISEAYANQIYSLAKNIIPYKFKLLKIAGWILIASLLLSLMLYVWVAFIAA